MKTYIPVYVLAVLTSCVASAEVLEKWTFDYPDGTPLSQMLSDQGWPLANADKPSARVRAKRLELDAQGDIDAIFLINEFSSKPAKTGLYEVAWTFASAGFARTHEVKGRANAGFDFRDTGDTRYKGKDDRVLGGVRLRYEKKVILIEYQDSTTDKFTEIARVERVVLPEPLHVRIRFDLDQAGQPGSMQVFLSLGDEPEIQPVTDGIIPEGVSLSGYRLIQQITNGGTNWQEGDYVTLDDFMLSRVETE